MTTENQVSPSEETQINPLEVTQTQELVKPETTESLEPQDKTDEKPELSEAEKDARAKQRRIDRLTRNQYESRAEIEQLRKALERQQPVERIGQGEPLSHEQIEEIVAKRVNQQVTAQTMNQRTAQVDKELQKSLGADLNNFYDDLKQAGRAGASLIEAAIELDDSSKVLAYLAKNPEEFDNVVELTPLKQAAYLGRLSAKLEGEKAQPTRSSAPAPITPVKGTATSDEPDINDTARWIAWSNKQDARKRNR